MKHKTEIEIEFSEIIAYARGSERVENFCAECGYVAEMAEPHIAAVITQMTEREIYRLVEAGRVHFIESERVLVCMRSLMEIKGEAKS